MLILTTNVVADPYIAIGSIYDADIAGKKMIAVGTQSGDWKFEVSYFEEYTRTAWYVDHPEWRHSPLTIVKSHSVFSITNKLYKKKFGEIEFFYDFGVAVTDRISSVNSSHLLFKHNVGLWLHQCGIYVSHTSNAGLAGVNAGEDVYQFGCGVSF